jgi:hippurate hydrolase
MDGLPVPEATGLPYASRVPGAMHACGHDIHMTGWVGTARWMAANKAKWSGTLMMVAQPAEEIVGGAKAMLDDGLYAKFAKPTHALAFHDSASLPAGQVGITDGYALANVDSIDLTVRGIGSHGSEPQNGIDPIVIAARIVGTLQTLVSRENDPRQPAVITVGSFHAGSKHNIIGDEAKLLITVRSYDPKVRERLLNGIRRVAKAEAEAAGVPDNLLPIITQSQPSASTFNTPKLTATVTTALEQALGKERVVRINASMAAEDFGAFSRGQDIESTIFWVGAQPQRVWDAAGGDIRKLPGLHSAKFAPDPAPTIATAVKAMTAAAMAVVGK